MRKSIYPLLSGGVDSTIATLKIMSSNDFDIIQPIFINYGQKACEQEWKSVCNVSARLAKLVKGNRIFRNPKRIDLACSSMSKSGIFQWSKSLLLTGDQKGDPYVENRNMILLSVAASFVESQIGKAQEGVIIAGFRDEWPDTQREFVASMNRVLSFLLAKKEKYIRIEAPIIDYGPHGKCRMVKDFWKYRNILELTWSCWNPLRGERCRICDACRGRKQALELKH